MTAAAPRRFGRPAGHASLPSLPSHLAPAQATGDPAASPVAQTGVPDSSRCRNGWSSRARQARSADFWLLRPPGRDTTWSPLARGDLDITDSVAVDRHIEGAGVELNCAAFTNVDAAEAPARRRLRDQRRRPGKPGPLMCPNGSAAASSISPPTTCSAGSLGPSLRDL